MTKQTCALRGCSKEVPMAALMHGDLHCSTGCFRADLGLVTVEQVLADEAASAKARQSAENTVDGWRDAGHASWERRERSQR